MAAIEEFLSARRNDGLLRELRPISARREGRVRVGAREYLDLSSNDYLGLAGHPRMAQAAKEALDEFGAGACASRLMGGDLDIFHRLEERVAKFKSTESALVFNSGYQANVGIFSALLGREDAAFCDRASHASILDGVRLSGARLFRFRHNDPAHLESLLKKERARFKDALIATETIFSMDGDRAPLRELVELKERHGCRMLADEAHATGVFGATGSGVVEADGLAGRIELVLGTFSKALGSFGAYLATSQPIVDYLVNTCRSFIYSTALPPAVVACNLVSLGLVAEEPGGAKRSWTAPPGSADCSESGDSQPPALLRSCRSSSARTAARSRSRRRCRRKAAGSWPCVRRPCRRARRGCGSR